MTTKLALLAAAAAVALLGAGAQAADLSVVSGAVGRDLEELRAQLDEFAKQSGHNVEVVSMPASTTDQFGQYRLWLSAQNPDIDVYRTDVIWAPQLAEHFVDLKPHMEAEIPKHFPSIIESQTVDGRLVAMPMFTDAPGLYFRTDLLEKYAKQPPRTWEELEAVAREIMDKERAAGDNDLYGFVFQGAPYEGLTCDGLEWVASHNGGQIVEPDGTISINNPQAAAALERAKGWVGTIAPEGVLAYQEEDSRGVWQTGNAVFMRNWPYAVPLGNSEDSAIKGKFAVTTLPKGGPDGKSAACLGGWNLAVSKYSPDVDAAVELVRYLASEEAQKFRALQNARLPTIQSLYDDPEIAEKQQIVTVWKDIFLGAVPRPSAPTKTNYNEVSKEFWTAVHSTLSGNGSAEQNLARLEGRLKRLKGSAW